MSSLAQTTGNKQMELVIATLQGKAKFTDPESVEALKLAYGWVKDGLSIRNRTSSTKKR